MGEIPEDGAAEPANLRFLRRLVTVLTAVMIAGLLAIFALLVIRFSQGAAPLALPEAVSLPEGLEPEAVTLGGDWLAVVAGEEILIYDRETGALRQRVRIESE